MTKYIKGFELMFKRYFIEDINIITVDVIMYENV